LAGNNSIGRRLAWATAAAVTMFVAPGPMELVQAIMRRRRLALAKAIAAKPIARSLCARKVGSRPHTSHSFADSSDIAMPENGKNAGKQRKFAAIDFARLNREITDERLGHRQADRGHPRAPWSILLRHGA
jgi:hypothetical protein